MVSDKTTSQQGGSVASTPPPDSGENTAEASQEVMSLLNEHVPLALLADLATPSGPSSPQILQDEGLPDVAWWQAEDGAEAPADPSEVEAGAEDPAR